MKGAFVLSALLWIALVKASSIEDAARKICDSGQHGFHLRSFTAGNKVQRA
jgi:hypothetical protein